MRSRRSLGAGADCHKSTFSAKNGGRRLKRTARGGEKRGRTGVRAPVGAGRARSRRWGRDGVLAAARDNALERAAMSGRNGVFAAARATTGKRAERHV